MPLDSSLILQDNIIHCQRCPKSVSESGPGHCCQAVYDIIIAMSMCWTRLVPRASLSCTYLYGGDNEGLISRLCTPENTPTLRVLDVLRDHTHHIQVLLYLQSSGGANPLAGGNKRDKGLREKSVEMCFDME